MPIAGMVFLSPSKPLYNGAVEYDASTTVAIVPTDFNLPSHRFIIGNVEPRSDLVNGMFLAAGMISLTILYICTYIYKYMCIVRCLYICMVCRC